MTKNTYRTISARAKNLLNRSEGIDVEFKLDRKGLSSEDLVAFANSRTGGAILIGVSEIESPGGQQRGEIVGCPTGDDDKLFILNKASQCIPPIDVEIIFENLNRKGFIRIEISSGNRKPALA